MSLWLLFAVALLTGVTGSPSGTVPPDDSNMTAHPNSVLENFWKPTIVVAEEAKEEVMETGELNPSHYPAQRAAKVVEHYVNTRHGSPYKVFAVKKVFSANAEEVPDSGRKYQLELSIQEMVHNTTVACAAEVLFPRQEESEHSPQVQLSCEEILKINTSAQEESLYQQYKLNHNLSTQNLPDSNGHVEEDQEPFWHLGRVASSFIMLAESSENTLYNMAQVANLTQMATENNQLKFDYHVLLHDMVSQEIIPWKLVVTWSPSAGVKVQKMEKSPNCRHCNYPKP
ncbi:latexin-like isoform X1 [Entelurus aequoreus]|uniref:latexin-like isoform X1 n=2 Tax=Entelurus aequoreus TaxID=161455 RepID=UPI002B1E0A29|nr:latexin-like isoform X1 [Entelurus aequoreus]